MTEYLAPGVYVEEYDSASKPIPGVSASIDGAIARSLVESFEHIVALAPPGWDQFNRSDPGITLIELFAWLAEDLVYRAGGVSDARRDALRRVLARLSTPPCAPACDPLVRPRFFAGRLLDAATLEAEQDYQREKLRRHNRALHGFGIVSGLDVHIDANGATPRVTVAPGYAIDCCGEEIELCERVMLQLPLDADEAFVSLRRWERASDPVPGPNGPEATRIEEACIVAISPRVPGMALALARMVHQPGGWSIDANFAAPTAGSTGGHQP